MRSSISSVTLLCCVGALAFGAARGQAAEARATAGSQPLRPNILLILADDLGFSDLGCYGSEIATPNLDRLAAEGVRFSQFYNSSRCCPSRAALLTGLYPHQAGMGDMAGGQRTGPPGYEGHLVDRCVTLPEVLKTAGYQAFMVGKWHLGARPNPVERGFDEFYGMIGGFNSFWQEHPYYTRLPAHHPRREYAPGQFYSSDAFGDYALDFLAQARRRPQQPWFLYLAFNAAHFPLHAPAAEVAKYEPIYARGWDQIRAERFARQKKLGVIPKKTVLTPRGFIPGNWANRQTGWADKDNPAWDSLPAERRADLARRMAVYAAMIDRMDQNIGRVLQDLRRHNELNHTLILFLSDNGACAEWDPYGFDGQSGPTNRLHRGDALKEIGGPDSYVSYGSGWANACNTPWRLYKHYGQEGGVATSFIAHWPAAVKPRKNMVTEPAHIIDLMPTLLQVAGAAYPQQFNGRPVLPLEGRSLLPAFQAVPGPLRTLFFEHEGHRAVREGRWKLVALSGQAWELYDVEADRSELQNLADRQPERVARMAQAWDQWAKRAFVRAPAARAGEAAIPTPSIANKELSISCEVDPKARDGVILAQGGDQHGYALWLREGQVVFSVRIQRALISVAAPETPSGRLALAARLRRGGSMELSINGRLVAQGKAPGLIPVQPQDELSVGQDSRSAVGDYAPPHPLAGTIEKVSVLAE